MGAAFSELHEHAVLVSDLPAMVSGAADGASPWFVNGHGARGEVRPVWGYLLAAEVPLIVDPAYSTAGVHVLLATTKADDARRFWHAFSTTAPVVRNVDGLAVIETAPARVLLSRSIPAGELCTVCGATVQAPAELEQAAR